MSVSAPYPDDDLDLDNAPPQRKLSGDDAASREVPTEFSFGLTFEMPTFDCCSLLTLKRLIWQVIPTEWRGFTKVTTMPDDDMLQVILRVPDFGNPEQVMEMRLMYDRQKIETAAHLGALAMVIRGDLFDTAARFLKQMVKSHTELMFP